MQFVGPMTFEEAIQKIGERSPIGSAMMSAEWADVPVALRERAFFSSQVESLRFLQRARDQISDYLAGARETLPGQTALKAGSRSVFVDQMRKFAKSEGMGPLAPEDEHGLKDITSERRLGLIFNTQTQQAGDYGYWRQGMDPDVLNEFPAQRFVRVQAVKQEREAHVPFENQVYLKTDPIWEKRINQDFGVPWGPWGWGCGHDVEDVDRDATEEAGLLKSGEKVKPQLRSFNEGLEASTETLDPDLVEKLKADLGEQLVVDDEAGTMSWAPAAVPVPAVRENAVSEAITVQAPGVLGEDMDAALAAIDRVHDDGRLPDLEAKTSKQSSYGYFRMAPAADGAGIEADHIGVRNTGPWPTFTMTHETGHFLDLEGIGAKGTFATSGGDPDMKRVLEAAEKTDAIKSLRSRLEETTSEDGRAYLRYLLKPQEIWARAYSQFIAKRSGFKALERDLKKALEAEKDRQWESGDFGVLEQAIEGMMRKLGWL